MQKAAVIGLGRFGSTVALELCRRGSEVLAVDRSLRLVEAVADGVTSAVSFDATDRANLKAYAIPSMDAVIVAIGTNFEASVLITMHCKTLGVPLVCAKAVNTMQEQVLLKVGADRVVKPEEDMGVRLAEHLREERLVDFVELPPGYSLRRFPVPAAWEGRSLADLRLLGDRRLCLVQVVRGADADGRRRKEPLPHGEIVLHAGDDVDAIGPVDVLDAITAEEKRP